jgi:HPt (histidine-containing phosphotransfer) domain-containing protein
VQFAPNKRRADGNSDDPEDFLSVDEWAGLLAVSFEGTALDCGDSWPAEIPAAETAHAPLVKPGNGRTDSALPSQTPMRRAPDPDAPLELQAALPRFDGDMEFFREMLEEFIDHLPGRVVELRTALGEEDAQKLNRLAHNLKGAAANFNAVQLTEFSKNLELQAKQSDLSNAASLIAGIETEMLCLKSFLDGLSR